MAGPTARDRAEARSLWGHCIDHEGEAGAVEMIAQALANERAQALRPFRDLEDGYALGSDVPVYRIGRAIDEVERATGMRPDHSATLRPPYCAHCEWDGSRLVNRCLACRRDLGRRVPLSTVSAAELLAPDEADGMSVRLEKPTRRSSLPGRPIPRRGHGASEGDPSL